MTLDALSVDETVATAWRTELVGELTEYVTIPALSPAFDPDWQANGHLMDAINHIRRWITGRPIQGMTTSLREIEGRTPLIMVEIDPFGTPSTDATVVLYGHCDKQPEMHGWREGLGPWTPVITDGKLYGRGGADDGYAAYASLTAIEAIQRSGGSHAGCVLLVEASEESGSPDLPAHVQAILPELGDVDLVICLDSGCNTYDTVWLTTSLRGMASATLSVDILTEGVHSGSASGVVPSSFRIARQLLNRVENVDTGDVLLNSANVEIPAHRIAEVEAMVAALGEAAVEPFPYVEGAGPVSGDVVASVLARTWKPTMSTIGADRFPPSGRAGNVLRPGTDLRLSFRLPPSADADVLLNELKETLQHDPPYGAHVRVHTTEAAAGWDAPELAPWLRSALDDAARSVFGQGVQLMGEGGSIPFMGMLGDLFPAAQFVIIGVLGPESNAHGPNEFLHLDYAEKLTQCLGRVLDRHATTSATGAAPT